MIPGRRRCLSLLGLGLLAPLAPAHAKPATPRLLRRWPTGNRLLAPVARFDRGIVCVGDRSLALIDPEMAEPVRILAHGLAGGAVFRPRIAGEFAICAGRQEIGAWNLTTGLCAWRHRARWQLGAPCVHDEQVFFGDGHELVALDLADGAARRRFAAVADTLISYAPAASGDTVLVGPGDGRLYALSTSNGRLRWKLDGTEEWQYLRQLHVGGEVLVAGGYKEKLYGIDIASGRRLWEFSAGNFINSHHVADGTAYLWSPTGWLYAIDTTSGQVRWRHRTTDYRGDAGQWASVHAELATLGDHLYALDLANVLHVLSTVDGREIARHALPEPVRPFVLPLARDQVMIGVTSGDLLLVTL